MSLYFQKVPFIIQFLFSKRVWKIDTNDKELFITFDDGPHPEITPRILEILSKFHAKVTFFQLGSKVLQYPDLHKRCISEGHSIGNHGHNHLKATKTNAEKFMKNISQGRAITKTDLYRPAYGILPLKVKSRILKQNKVIMWDVMPGDFDAQVKSDKCLNSILKNASEGSIIVLHENDKSRRNVLSVLPKLLKHYSSLGYSFKPITNSIL